jgi:hypothetical protein
VAFVDAQPRKVTFDLAEPEYHRAVAAHDQQQTVVCYGVLLREGRSYRLNEPHDFSVADDE